jgi:hypothetical protein
MTPHHEPPEEEWRTLARQASKEEDPDKLIELTQQFIEKFDEAQRRKRPGAFYGSAQN